jgi:hypothetical protein
LDHCAALFTPGELHKGHDRSFSTPENTLKGDIKDFGSALGYIEALPAIQIYNRYLSGPEPIIFIKPI